jgi:hypothetical protein
MSASGAAGAAERDAELIALCDEWSELECRISALGTGLDAHATDAEVRAATAPLEALQSLVWPRITKLRATTPAGIMARAKALAIHAGHGDFDMEPNWTTCAGTLFAVLTRDVLTMHGLPLPKVLTEEQA